MTGDDQPRPGTRDFHRTFCVSLHASGSPRSTEWPCPVGPRNSGHCAEPSAVARAMTRMRTGTPTVFLDTRLEYIYRRCMKLATLLGLSAAGVCAIAIVDAAPADDPAGAPAFNARAAAGYLDGRMEWWLHWPNAARDHETSCVSCHTALPYALARPALRRALGEHDMAAPERAMIASVVKRVTLWNEVEPFYPDQTRGLPKSSESRGTEAILNALVLAARDAATGTLTSEARQAMANMWALQFKAGELKGAWAWLN